MKQHQLKYIRVVTALSHPRSTSKVCWWVRRGRTHQLAVMNHQQPESGRSQVKEFYFKQQCLFCAELCKPVDLKHPDRWEKVTQCERMAVKDAPPFKNMVLQYCEDRNDSWGREVAMPCHGVHDLSSAEAQYHRRCYDEFRKIPLHGDQIPTIDDTALKLLVDYMYKNKKLCTWTSLELHDMYISYGGQLIRKQMFTKLITYLGDDVVVLRIEGCASIVGFRDLSSSTRGSSASSV